MNCLSILLCFPVLLMINGCCNKADCLGSGGTIELRLLKNGEVATGGPGALINPELISYYPEGYDDLYNPVFFIADSQVISFFLNTGRNYILMLDEYRNDTISVTAETVSKGSCGCHESRVTSVTYNGVVLCNDSCENVLDVEL